MNHQERVAGRTLKERIIGLGWQEWEAIDDAFERGEIDQAEWHRRTSAILGPAYLGADNPRAQSGSSNTPEQWERARRFIFDGVDRDGTLLDIGCASGHLMECAVPWLLERGIRVEPYGLDIIPELADLARRRLPHWADRIFVGNAADWVPARPFDFVRTGLEYVPPSRRHDFIVHLLNQVVKPGGRLIIGAHSEPTGSQPQREAEVSSFGFEVKGRVEVPHTEDPRVVRRAFWIDQA
jgi:SAM-dependent methyltransferase